jgi:tetratricopeptide (TPR) repeat protein
VFARYVLARALAEVGRFDEALPLADDAIRVAELSEHTPSLARALSDVGFIHLERGDLDRAIPILERGVALGRELDFPTFYDQIVGNLGVAYARVGREAEARAVLAPLTDAQERLQRTWASTLVALAQVYLEGGDAEAARVLAERARSQYLPHLASRQRDEVTILLLLGDVAARQEPPDTVAAEDALQAALGAAEASGLRPLAAQCRLSLGQLYGRLGRAAEARAELAAAAEAFQTMGMDSYLATAERLLPERI